jgi:hypothetical protein
MAALFYAAQRRLKEEMRMRDDLEGRGRRRERTRMGESGGER